MSTGHDSPRARRVVTGFDEHGKSTIVADDDAGARLERPGGATVTEIWRADSLPARMDEAGPLAALEVVSPAQQGLAVRVCTFPPDAAMDSQTYGSYAESIAQSYGPEAASAERDAVPGMHSTETVDVVTVGLRRAARGDRERRDRAPRGRKRRCSAARPCMEQPDGLDDDGGRDHDGRDARRRGDMTVGYVGLGNSSAAASNSRISTSPLAESPRTAPGERRAARTSTAGASARRRRQMRERPAHSTVLDRSCAIHGRGRARSAARSNPSRAARSRHSARAARAPRRSPCAPRRERRHLRRRGARRAAALQLGLDLRAPPAERPQHVRRHAGDVGDAVAHRRPLDAEPLGQLRAQPRLVEVAGRLRVLVDRRGRRAPTTARRCPRARLATSTCVCSCGSPARDVRCRNAAATKPCPSIEIAPARAAPATRRDALQVAERVRDRLVVRHADRAPQRLVADAEQHAHALRRRERQSNPGTRARVRAAERAPLLGCSPVEHADAAPRARRCPRAPSASLPGAEPVARAPRCPPT